MARRLGNTCGDCRADPADGCSTVKRAGRLLSFWATAPYVAAMTATETMPRRRRRRAGGRRPLARRVRPRPCGWRLPMALTQLGQIAMMTTDLVLIGRLGDAALAAAALAHTVLFAAFTRRHGAACRPWRRLAAQAYRRAPAAHGAPRAARRAVGSADAGRAADAGAVLGRGHPARARPGARGGRAGRPLSRRAWPGAILPAWTFIALRNFMGAVNRPEPALWITLAAIPVNAVLAYALIYGAFGLPALDLLGAGLATALVNVGMCAAAIWIAYTRHPFKKYRVLGRFWRPDWPLLRQAGRDRPADLGRAAAGVRAVCGRRAADGPHLHERGCRAPDRAADGGACSTWCRSASRWPPRCASARPRAGAMPSARAAPASPPSALGVGFMAVMTLIVGADARMPSRCSSSAPRRRSRPTRSRWRRRCWCWARASSSPTALQTVAGGRAARPQRHARAAAVLRAQLLGASASSAACGWPSRWGSAPSASGSACRSAPPSMPACWCGASTPSPRGTICRTWRLRLECHANGDGRRACMRVAALARLGSRKSTQH